jgi:hypothetical protein
VAMPFDILTCAAVCDAISCVCFMPHRNAAPALLSGNANALLKGSYTAFHPLFLRA